MKKLSQAEVIKLNELKAREADLTPKERDEMDKLQVRLDEEGQE